MIKTLIRGGQVSLHNFNMLRQVMTVTIILTALAGVVFWSCKTWFSYEPYERYVLASYYWAGIKLSLPGPKERVTQIYHYANGQEYIVRSLDLKQNQALQVWAKDFEARMEHNAWLSLWIMLGFSLLLSGAWFWYGYKQKQPKILNGLSIVSWRKLRRKVRKFGEAQQVLGKLPYPKSFETEHMVIVGTTGSGKTNIINQLLGQTRPLGNKTIIVDTTGGYVARFYNPETDKILNPFDERSETWNLWDECHEDYDFMEFAESLIPPAQRDPFWVNASQQLLATAAEKLKEENKMTIAELLNLLLSKPLSEVAEDFKGTSVVTYLDPESGKMAHSIRATLIAALWSLKYLEKAKSYFSIREWVQDPLQSGCLFICCQPGQRNVLRPLMTGWLSIAIKSLMALPQDLDRRTWFIIDELASLNYVPCLVRAFQEVRKYGGCMVVGMQDYAQVHKLYGRDDCNSMFDLSGTKIGLCSNGNSATELSKSFGYQEILEVRENTSLGAHEMRDGLSLSRQRHVKPVVSATDLMMLNPLEAYIKYPRNLPITKIKFTLYSLPSVAPEFLKKQGVLPISELRRLTALSNEIYAENKEAKEKATLEKEDVRQTIQMGLD